MEIIDSLLISLSSSWIVQSYNYLSSDFCLNDYGILAYVTNSLQDLKKSEIILYEEEKIGSESEKKKLLKNTIVDIIRGLFLKFPIEFFSRFLVVWNNDFPKEKQPLEIKDKFYKVSLIEMLANNGGSLREPYSKHLIDGIFELRAKVGSDISRVLYFFVFGKKIILTNGFVKKTQKTPKHEIELAQKYRNEFLDRERKQNDKFQ